jgi:hypothetical protein
MLGFQPNLRYLPLNSVHSAMVIDREERESRTEPKASASGFVTRQVITPVESKSIIDTTRSVPCIASAVPAMSDPVAVYLCSMMLSSISVWETIVRYATRLANTIYMVLGYDLSKRGRQRARNIRGESQEIRLP